MAGVDDVGLLAQVTHHPIGAHQGQIIDHDAARILALDLGENLQPLALGQGQLIDPHELPGELAGGGARDVRGVGLAGLGDAHPLVGIGLVVGRRLRELGAVVDQERVVGPHLLQVGAPGQLLAAPGVLLERVADLDGVLARRAVEHAWRALAGCLRGAIDVGRGVGGVEAVVVNVMVTGSVVEHRIGHADLGDRRGRRDGAAAAARGLGSGGHRQRLRLRWVSAQYWRISVTSSFFFGSKPRFCCAQRATNSRLGGGMPSSPPRSLRPPLP